MATDLTGRPAAPFALDDLDGVRHTVEVHAGRWTLLVFHRHLG